MVIFECATFIFFQPNPCGGAFCVNDEQRIAIIRNIGVHLACWTFAPNFYLPAECNLRLRFHRISAPPDRSDHRKYVYVAHIKYSIHSALTQCAGFDLLQLRRFLVGGHLAYVLRFFGRLMYSMFFPRLCAVWCTADLTWLDIVNAVKLYSLYLCVFFGSLTFSLDC